jgi:hypothetical protein
MKRRREVFLTGRKKPRNKRRLKELEWRKTSKKKSHKNYQLNNPVYQNFLTTSMLDEP